MKHIAKTAIVAGIIGAAITGAAGTATATIAPALPHTFPSGSACMEVLDALEAQEGVPGAYGCSPIDPHNFDGPTVLDRRR